MYLDKVGPQFIENLLRNSLRWPIYIINSVDKTKLSGYTPYRPSTTISLETYLLYLGRSWELISLNITFTDHLCSSFLFFFFPAHLLWNNRFQFNYPSQFWKNVLLHKNNPTISVFLKFTTKTQINGPLRRYETVRFNWYRQCCILCYVRPENCLKMFESSCLTAQEVNLQKRRFFWLIKASGDASPFISLVWKTEKITPVLQEFIAWSASGKKAQNHLRGGGGAIQSIPSLHLTWGDTKRGALVDRFQRNDQSQGLGVFIKPP